MYGGRVMDNFDRRVLITYLNEYMGDFLFDTFQPFHFYVSPDGAVDYCVPQYVFLNSFSFAVILTCTRVAVLARRPIT